MAGASEFVTSRGFVDAPDGRADTELRGVSAEGVQQSLDLRPVAGSLSGLRGDTVALSDKKAEEYGVGSGTGFRCASATAPPYAPPWSPSTPTTPSSST